MILLRTLSRLIGTALMLAIALVGLGVAGYCLDGLISLGSARPDRVTHIASLRDHVGRFLANLAHPGSTAGLALICAVAAVLIGLLLLIGTLRPSRRRLVMLEVNSSYGDLAARPRPLRDMARAQAEKAPGATAVKRPKLSLARRGTRGKLTVVASRAKTSDRDAVLQAVKDRVEPLIRPFGLRPRVRVRLGERGERVE